MQRFMPSLDATRWTHEEGPQITEPAFHITAHTGREVEIRRAIPVQFGLLSTGTSVLEELDPTPLRRPDTHG